MRVVDPRQFSSAKKQKSKTIYVVISIIAISIVATFSLIYGVFTTNKTTEITTATTVNMNEEIDHNEVMTASEQSVAKEAMLRVFTDNEFKVFYDRLLQPDLERVTEPPVISGNQLADTRMRDIAETRGYRLRSSPNSKLVNVDGYLMHESVAAPWQSLKQASQTVGLQMRIVSGYRSVASQRDLFLSRLGAAGASISQVAAGKADDKVNDLLITTSIPGYSKHHTGYTIDLFCSGFEFEKFADSTCNTWLSADNYKVAKENGFIPSYPPLADAQGPDSEAWEYVYVGTEFLYQ